MLRDAAVEFDALDMGLFAAAARRRMGELRGGEQGAAIVAAADAWMAGRRIADPARIAALHVPGAFGGSRL